MKKILVPNGNYTDIRLIQCFKEMGLYVITSGNNPSLSGHKYADEYVPHDYSDYDGMLSLAKDLQIDYISACSNDFGVTTAAYIAEKMALPGHDSFETAKIIAEKDLFKEFAIKNGLDVIPSSHFNNKEDAYKYINTIDYPIIIKPTDLGGGKGVTKVDNYNSALEAIDYAFEKSKIGHIVIEPYIEGSQHSFCSFLYNKKVVSFTSFNEFGAYNNEFLVGYTTSPADSINEVSQILIGNIEKMASLLNLSDGIFHVQYRMHKGRPLIMECMRRCLGNYALRAASEMLGFKIEKFIAMAYCGYDCSSIPKVKNLADSGYYAHYYIQPIKNGVISNVIISEELQKYVYDYIKEWQEGTIVDNYNVQMLGFLFLKFPDKKTRDFYSKDFRKFIHIKYK